MSSAWYGSDSVQEQGLLLGIMIVAPRPFHRASGTLSTRFSSAALMISGPFIWQRALGRIEVRVLARS